MVICVPGIGLICESPSSVPEPIALRKDSMEVDRERETSSASYPKKLWESGII